jgi:hypothetical protein
MEESVIGANVEISTTHENGRSSEGVRRIFLCGREESTALKDST